MNTFCMAMIRINPIVKNQKHKKSGNETTTKSPDCKIPKTQKSGNETTAKSGCVMLDSEENKPVRHCSSAIENKSSIRARVIHNSA